jgi:thymidine kinase
MLSPCGSVRANPYGSPVLSTDDLSTPTHLDGRSERVRAGRLEVVCGSMFSGKSEELIRRLVRADIGRQRVWAVKPALDSRYAAAAIVSHAGRRWPCAAVERAEDIMRIVEEHDPDVLGVEEAQFFDPALPAVLRRVVGAGVRVICAGLDLDAMGRPFGPLPELIAEAEQVTKLSAVCVRCGGEAHRSQLLVDGEPAPWRDGPLINVGGAETYEARCRACFEVPGRPG